MSTGNHYSIFLDTNISTPTDFIVRKTYLSYKNAFNNKEGFHVEYHNYFTKGSM